MSFDENIFDNDFSSTYRHYNPNAGSKLDSIVSELYHVFGKSTKINRKSITNEIPACLYQSVRIASRNSRGESRTVSRNNETRGSEQFESFSTSFSNMERQSKNPIETQRVRRGENMVQNYKQRVFNDKIPRDCSDLEEANKFMSSYNVTSALGSSGTYISRLKKPLKIEEEVALHLAIKKDNLESNVCFFFYYFLYVGLYFIFEYKFKPVDTRY